MTKQKKAITLFAVITVVLTALLGLAFDGISSLISGNAELSEQFSKQGMDMTNMFTPLNAFFAAISVSLVVTLLAAKQFKPLIGVVLFMAIQACCSIFTPFLAIIMSGRIDMNTFLDMSKGVLPEHLYPALAIVLLLSSVLAIICFALIKYVNLKEEFNFKKYNWALLPICVLAVNPGMFGSDIINEFVKLDNIMEAQFTGMAQSIFGFLAIGIVGPIAEEVLFRSVVLGSMLRKGVAPWLAICTSALIFGVFHGNPAQIPFAFFAGILMGILYYRTKSLIPSTVCHIVNNSVAVIMMNVYAEQPDITMSEMLGGQAIAICVSVATLLLCIALIIVFCRKQPAPQWQDEQPQLGPPAQS